MSSELLRRYADIVRQLNEAKENQDDTSFERAEQYVKSNYQFSKTYRAKRMAPSGFYMSTSTGELIDDPELAKYNASVFDKSQKQTAALSSSIKFHELTPIASLTGDHQISATIGYSWITLENKDLGIAIFYYVDRGMGADEITIGAKSKDMFVQVYQNFIKSGVIADPKAAKDQAAKKRLDIIAKRGFKVGTTFVKNGNTWTISSITPSGLLVLKDQSSQTLKDKPGNWHPSLIKKG